MTTSTMAGVRTPAGADAEAIAAIYNQAIAERRATFDTEPVSAEEVGGWLGDDSQPVLIAEAEGRVVGWTRAIRSPERCALAGVGEYVIYLDTAARRRGIGRLLLTTLVATTERIGYWKLQGRLFTTNAASRALARRGGFREVGVYERHGRLDGEWKDLLIVERLLGDAVR